ncbi:MAG: M1 family metallopeptidase [Acidobacteriota bacterium]
MRRHVGIALFAGLMAGSMLAASAPPAQPVVNRAAIQDSAVPPPAPRSPRNANYTISARLDPARRTITGTERLAWRNTAAVPATTLRFHLYYNAWRNTGSSWMRERALSATTRADQRPVDDFGWIDVTSIGAEGTGGRTADLTSRARFIAPDDGNADDRTVMEVPVDTPIAPGQTITLQIAWTLRIPRTFARTGAVGNFFFIAQWFPKIGVLEDGGWNAHQFHSPTEFFADFGTYDVQLTVPEGWIVGATGVERDRRQGPDGTTTHHYYQEDVHDFAWTTSPDYLDQHAVFEDAKLPRVDIRLLLQPEHVGQAERHFAAARATLKYYGQWFGPYPYTHLTVVDPAWQSNAGGMEYPTLITAGSRWLAPRGALSPEGVTIHEAGHQWWYGLVASNEFEHAWMDEGLNTFATARVIEQAFPRNDYVKRYFGDFVPWLFRGYPLTRQTDGDRMGPYRLSPKGDAQSTPTFRYWPATASVITYNKTALWLHTLERLLGWETVQRILSTYFSRWAFRHPAPQDFFDVVNEVSGRDLTWFFDQVYRSSTVFDYGVDTFRSEVSTVQGRVDGEQGPSPREELKPSRVTTTVVVRRFGEGIFPVDVRVVFENQEEVRWHWDGLDRWKLFQVEKPVRASFVQVDPEHVLLLDVNYTNNSATLQPQAKAAARKWSLLWLVWLQDHLLTYGFFV